MKKPIVFLLLGVAIGAASGYLLRSDKPSPTFTRDSGPDIQEVAEISVAAAAAHREDRYTAIRSIEDILSLPSDFAETEALYVAAGRANSGEVQNLIQQAARVRDYQDRKASLRILFLRLTELDPPSALAIARTPTFAADKSYEDSIWIGWGRFDLVSAVQAAARLDTRQKKQVAQALYASLRSLDNDQAAMIEATLDIRPGTRAVAQHVRALVDESPASAIAFIESSRLVISQNNQFAMLGSYLARNATTSPSNLSELIRSPQNRMIFEQAMTQQGLRADPETALQNALAEKSNQQSMQRVYVALQQLGMQDPAKALEYVDRLPRNPTTDAYLIGVIGTMAANNPQRVLAWIRENDRSGKQELLMGALMHIAQRDPQLALTEIQTIKSDQVRDQLLSNIVMSATVRDPAAALSILEQISSAQMRKSSTMQLAQMWARTDLAGALDWVTTLNSGDQTGALQSIGQQLAETDVTRAIELLDRFPKSATKQLRVQIARGLVRSKSIRAAETFIAEYKGTDEYLALQQSVIGNAAAIDPDYAMQMARSVEDVRTRDNLYTTIVRQQADTDPRLALQWAKSISTSESRVRATSRIVSTWYRHDRATADHWLQGLPHGAERDAAVVAAVSTQYASPADADRLIASIGDAAQRKNARLARVRQLMNSDIAAARRKLANIDLSDAEREQYEQWFNQVRSSY